MCAVLLYMCLWVPLIVPMIHIPVATIAANDPKNANTQHKTNRSWLGMGNTAAVLVADGVTMLEPANRRL